ncbi:MAG: hypothetical protein JOZ63_03515 [Planctomycetaceae bacterium]|nr:hypothetical protein [Planctomycetaceae bacterium]
MITPGRATAPASNAALARASTPRLYPSWNCWRIGCFGCAAALAYASRNWQGVFVGRGGVASGAVPASLGALAEADAFTGPEESAASLPTLVGEVTIRHEGAGSEAAIAAH